MFWLCRVVGDGSDAEANVRRPALAEHQRNWGFCTYAGGSGFAIVKAEHMPAFDGDALIQPMRKAQLAGLGAPDDGEADDADDLGLALKFTKRFLLREILGANDFTRIGFTLDGRLRDIPAARRDGIRARLLAYRRHIDFAQVPLDASVGDALRFILPQIPARVTQPPPRKSGTFTDNFVEPTADTNLDAHTPSGGLAWTLVAGGTSTHAIIVAATDQLKNNAGGDSTGSLFQCDDQGSANQYVQAEILVACNAFICNRASDADNYVGARIASGNAASVQVRNAGGFSAIVSSTIAAGSVVKLESDGANSHTLYDDGVAVPEGPGSSAHNSAITRQGINARSVSVGNWLDNFEAGTLAATSADSITPALAAIRRHRSTLLRM